MQLIKKIGLSLATVLVMAVTLAAIILLHLYKISRKLRAFARRLRAPNDVPPQSPPKVSGNDLPREEDRDPLEPVSAQGKT